jgi:serine/threonine-protein kinase
MRILAADDDRITRKLLGVNLERWGYDVVMASDGLEAWEILQDDNAPEIVVLDWVMPGMDGIEVCRALRKQSERSYRYVILLAPKAQKNDVLAAFEAGADDHIAKPVNLKDLEERLTTAVRGLEARKRHGVMPTRPGDLDFEPASEVTKVEPESPTQATLAGKVVGGKYRVVRPIASGGMGSVWEGVHLTLGTRVAIKFIRPEYAKDDDSMARFETEARVMARLQSRYAVHVYDYGFTPGGLPYLVMEYLEGQSLTGVIEQGGPLPLTEVVHLMSQAAHALEKAHRLGIIHRDVKPENIMLVPDADAADEDNAQMVKLVDFGVAKVLLENEAPVDADGGAGANSLRRPTARGVLLGTPAFMSPEQLLASGVADKHADLWGLAACAFVAATSKLPYNATTLGDLVKQVCLNPPPVPSAVNPGLPASFDAWFARACASNPADRFQSGYEFARELQAACGVSRASMFSTYPTPLPGAELMTPPMGLPAVRTHSNPDPVRRSDPNNSRTMRPVFAPGPPKPQMGPEASKQHPPLGSSLDPDAVPVVKAPTPALPAARSATPKAGVPATAPSAPLRPTSLRAAPRVSPGAWAMRVAFVLMLCGIAFVLGARFY